SIGGKYAPPLLLRFSNCPGAQNNAARCLVDQLRTLPGEKRQPCYHREEENMPHPFCCASAIALVHRTMPRGAWWISCEPFLVKSANHVTIGRRKICPTPFVALQQLPWCTEQCRAVLG